MAGAIGKLPDGLRPPPRVRRREILLVSFRKKRGTIRGANGGRYTFLPRQRIPRQKSLSSVSLTADSSLCGGSLLAHFLQSLPFQGRCPPQAGGGVHPPPRTSAAALSAAVDSRKLQETAPASQAEPTPKNRARQTPAALREGARGRGFSQRSRLPRSSPPSVFPRFMVYSRS